MRRRPENVVEDLLSFGGILILMIWWSAVLIALTACTPTEPFANAECFGVTACQSGGSVAPFGFRESRTICFWNPLYQVWSNEPTPDVIAEDRIGCP